MTNHNLHNRSRQASCVHEDKLRSAINEYENDNMSIAIPQLLELAERDCEEAFLYLSFVYRDGDGAQKDEFKSVQYKKKYIRSIEAKAAAGLPTYQLKFAYILQFGDGIAIDNARALSLFLELAKGGDGEAQFHLSRIYAHGNCGQRKDAALELKWLNEATMSEWPLAIYYSALLLASTANTMESTSQIIAMMNRSSVSANLTPPLPLCEISHSEFRHFPLSL